MPEASNTCPNRYRPLFEEEQRLEELDYCIVSLFILYVILTLETYLTYTYRYLLLVPRKYSVHCELPQLDRPSDWPRQPRRRGPSRALFSPQQRSFRPFHFPVASPLLSSLPFLSSVKPDLPYLFFTFPPSSLLLLLFIAMAPITEETVAGLKDTIGKLEARIEDLEGRLGQPKPKSVAEQMRIILMGPPGAGKCGFLSPSFRLSFPGVHSTPEILYCLGGD